MAEWEEPKGAKGRVERYLEDEIVVGLAHEQRVLKQLADLGIDPTKRQDAKEQSPELGLTKLSFDPDEVERGVRKLELDNWNQYGSPYGQALRRMADERGGMDKVPPVDKLLLGLRRIFADDNDRWTPDIGKNRYVERVIGKPWVSGGAEGDPQPPDPPIESWPARPVNPGQGVRVGMLDTVVVSHPWLAGAYIAESAAVQPPTPRPARWNLSADRSSPKWWWSGHGTFVMGLILQGAPAAAVELRTVLDEKNGDGNTWKVATELVRLANSGVQLVNLSLGTFTDDGQAPLVLERAVERLSSRVLVVAAAGNHGNVGPKPEGFPGPWPRANSALWPAALTDVLAVGAVDAQRGNAPFSPLAPWIDVTAEGVGCRSTYLNARVERSGDTKEFNGYAQWSGTSFAAGIVSGAIAAEVRPESRSAQDVARDLLGSGKQDLLERPFIEGRWVRG